MAKAFEVQNARALTDVLNRLGNIASEDVLRQAAVAGAREIFNEVKLRAPVGDATYERKGGTHLPGTLAKSILIAYDKEASLQGKIASYIVTWSKDGFYGRFIEYGHFYVPPRPVGVKQADHRAANRAKFVPASPFLRPAYEAKKQAAASAVTNVIERKTKEFSGG